MGQGWSSLINRHEAKKLMHYILFYTNIILVGLSHLVKIINLHFEQKALLYMYRLNKIWNQ